MKIKKMIYMLLFIMVACSTEKQEKLTSYIDPFIGTGGHVHTFPGACLPQGMVQLSPDNDTKGWDWCSGYHNSIDNIKGFSHTHLSGTGWADLGDISIMPTNGKINFVSGTKENPDGGYRSRIDKKTETAKAGYYSVMLTDYDIKAELTTTLRAGIQRYTFSKNTKSNILIDPTNKIFGKVIETSIEIVSNNTINGYCKSSGWGGNRYVYFSMNFSKPFSISGIAKDNKLTSEKKKLTGENIKAYVQYDTKKGEQIVIKLAISSVSIKNAVISLSKETKNKTFDQIAKKADDIWENVMNKIQIKGTNKQKRIFYTGMYHSFIHPNLYQDYDGSYTANEKNFKSKKFTNYSTFSFWDTFRATQPLYTLINTKVNTQIINSLIERHKTGGELPLWELCGYDNACMIGYPAIPVIYDAIRKGNKNIDKKAAYAAMRSAAFHTNTSSSDGLSGLDDYIKLGYVPSNIQKCVSKTLEYAYADWCIYMLAKDLKIPEDVKLFKARSQNFINLYNKDKACFWPKDKNGKFVEGVNTKEWNDLLNYYISGNLWAYEYFVPHAIDKLIELKGGAKAFEKSLDKLFTTKLEMEGEQHVDISGFIGHYSHGDEPGHYITYLYNYVNAPKKSQKIIRQTIKEMYNDTKDGMCNNEDCGQMSSWYIFSAMGFYPVCPGSNEYILGSPILEEAKINLDNGKVFTIVCKNQGENNIYVKSVKLNGKLYTKHSITHETILNGGVLEFEMSSK